MKSTRSRTVRCGRISEMLGLEFWWLKDAPSADPFDLRDPRYGQVHLRR